MTAFCNGSFDHAQTNDRQRRGRTGNDNIVPADSFREVRQTNGFGMDGPRQRLPFFHCAVGNSNALRRLGSKMRRTEFNHFAGTDKENVFIFEIAIKTER